MNIKRYVLGSIAVFVFFFLYEWLVHGVILNSWYQEGLNLLRPVEQMESYAAWMTLGFLKVKGSAKGSATAYMSPLLLGYRPI